MVMKTLITRCTGVNNKIDPKRLVQYDPQTGTTDLAEGVDIDIDDYDSSLQPLISAGADTEIIFAKYRGGSIGTTMLKWVGDKTKFVDVMDYDDKVDYINESYNELPKPTIDEAFDGPVDFVSDLDDKPFG